MPDMEWKGREGERVERFEIREAWVNVKADILAQNHTF